MGSPEYDNFPLLYVVKCPYVGGWVVLKRLKTPLRNIKMAPNGLPTCLEVSEGVASQDMLLNEKWFYYTVHE